MLVILILALCGDPNYVAGATPPKVSATAACNCPCGLPACNCGCCDGRPCDCNVPANLRGLTYAAWKAKLKRVPPAALPAPIPFVPLASRFRAAPSMQFNAFAPSFGRACAGGG